MDDNNCSQTSDRKIERRIEISLFVILVVCFTYFFPRWADPNQNSRLDMVVAVVDEGTFQIDNYVANTVDYAKVGDHYYSDKAPGTALIGIPVYAGLKTVLSLPLFNNLMERLKNNEAFNATLRETGSGILEQKVRFAIAQVALTFVVSVIPSAVLAILIFRILGYLSFGLPIRVATTLIYALLTPAFPYAGAFYGHQLSAALLFGAFYLIFLAKSDSKWSLWLMIGILLGYSVVTEYPSAFVVVVLVIYSGYRLNKQKALRHMVWLILGGAILAVGWMFYNDAIFGGPLNLGYSYSELWQGQHHTGFMSLTLPHWNAIWGITFGDFRGLFFLSPVLLISLPGAFFWWRSGKYRPEWIVVVASSCLMFLFNSSSSMWWGGFSIGPRYLLPMLPFWALPIGFAFARWGNRRLLMALVGFLIIWSLIVTWGLTLAEQAFPPDTIPNPLVSYALPNWEIGNIARNFGTILGLTGIKSLIPLVGWLSIMTIVLLGFIRRANTHPPIDRQF